MILVVSSAVSSVFYIAMDLAAFTSIGPSADPDCIMIEALLVEAASCWNFMISLTWLTADEYLLPSGLGFKLSR